MTRSAPHAPLLKDEDSRPLPDGWRWVRLGEVCELVGDSIEPQNLSDETFAHYSIPAFDAGQKPVIELGATILSNKVFFPNGVVLFSKLNPRIARVWYVADYQSYRRICSTEFLPLLPNLAGLDPDYLTFVLQEPRLIAGLRARVQAATKSRERIRPEMVLSAGIPLPPLPEQQRIVSILSEQMAAVEQARAAAEARLQAAKALPAAYLRAVFDSPEAQQWPRRRLGEVALLVQNGIYKSADNYGHGHPFLRMYNVQNDSWYLSLKTLAQVELQDGETETFGLRLGDLLISRVNSFELVGKCAWVGPEAEDYVFENMLIRVRLGNSVDSLFVAQQMSIPVVREQIEKVAKRAIGQASINSKDIRDIQISLPPLPDQRRIAAILNEQMEAVERARKALQEELDTISKLPAALLRRAFAGGL